MSELNQLREALLAQVREKGERQLAAAKKQHQVEMTQQKERLLVEREQVRQRRLAEVTAQAKRQQQQVHYQMRQADLTAKQSILTELFDAARHQLESWQENELMAFLTQVLDNYQADAFELTLGELTQAKLSDKAQQDLQARYPQMTLRVPLRHEAGFIVTVGRVDYNYLFHELVQAIYQNESYQIAHQIFEA